MIRRSTVAVIAVTAGLLGAKASPCKPVTVTSLARSETLSNAFSDIEIEAISTIPSVSEVSSTISAETMSTITLETSLSISTETASGELDKVTSSTLFEATHTTMESSLATNTISTALTESASVTVTETMSTAAAISASIAVSDSTESTTISALLTDETTTALVSSTTTAAAPVSIKTQAVVNPGFDDNDNGLPWVYDGALTNYFVKSEPNALALTIYNGNGQAAVSQTLHNLKGYYLLTYYWTYAETLSDDEQWNCKIHHKIGDVADYWYFLSQATTFRRGSMNYYSGRGVVEEAEFSITIQCEGTFNQITFILDDIKLTKTADI